MGHQRRDILFQLVPSASQSFVSLALWSSFASFVGPTWQARCSMAFAQGRTVSGSEVQITGQQTKLGFSPCILIPYSLWPVMQRAKYVQASLQDRADSATTIACG